MPVADGLKLQGTDKVLVNGVILVNKGKGVVSHNIVQGVRKIFPKSKVGHIGTLDPAATGLLPVMLGQANRLHLYLSRGKKSYTGKIFLGQSTDTYDSEGKSTSPPCKADFSENEIIDVLTHFYGIIEQVPPPFSAVKFNGKPSHRYAREGQLLQLKPRKVEVYSISLDSLEGNILRVSIDCSQGTYIRSIANDIGLKLGCGAYLQELERTAVGELNIEDAVSMEQLKEKPEDALSSTSFKPLEQLLPSLPVFQALDEDARLFSCGGRINFISNLLIAADAVSESHYQKADDKYIKVFFGKQFLGIGMIESDFWVKPVAVFGAGLEM
jgi:tRNA pseudouridine55 synthase